VCHLHGDGRQFQYLMRVLTEIKYRKSGHIPRDTRRYENAQLFSKPEPFIADKAEAEGIVAELVDKYYTSQTCLLCVHQDKPRGHTYTCLACRLLSHRDVVGRVNILSVFRNGEPGKTPSPLTPN